MSFTKSLQETNLFLKFETKQFYSLDICFVGSWSVFVYYFSDW